MPLTDLLLLVVAGFAAGIIGTAGGITSLVAYPALLLVGVSPLAANVTDSIALVGSGIGSSLSSRPELAGRGRELLRWLPVAVGGAIVGAVLLLVTPESAFARIVPWLIAVASVLLLIQPLITRWHVSRGTAPHPALAIGGVLFVTVYDGYFGAGSGIMMIALVLLLIEHELVTANAMKNVLLMIADLLPAVIFAIWGPVDWWGVLGVGVGATLGGVVGPRVARRLPPGLLRVLIAVCGLGLAGYLAVT